MSTPVKLSDRSIVYGINSNMRLIVTYQGDKPSWLKHQHVQKGRCPVTDLCLLSAGILLVALIWIGALSL